MASFVDFPVGFYLIYYSVNIVVFRLNFVVAKLIMVYLCVIILSPLFVLNKNHDPVLVGSNTWMSFSSFVNYVNHQLKCK